MAKMAVSMNWPRTVSEMCMDVARHEGLGVGGLSPSNKVHNKVFTLWATIITSQGELWMTMLIDFRKFVKFNFFVNFTNINKYMHKEICWKLV